MVIAQGALSLAVAHTSATLFLALTTREGRPQTEHIICATFPLPASYPAMVRDDPGTPKAQQAIMLANAKSISLDVPPSIARKLQPQPSRSPVKK